MCKIQLIGSHKGSSAYSSSPLLSSGGPSIPCQPHDNCPSTPQCRTQGSGISSPTAIRLGSHGRIPRYHAGATLHYYVDLSMFPTTVDGEYVAECFKKATHAWVPVPVHFKRVFALEDAFFSIIGSDDTSDNRTLAEAFFPDSPMESRILKVYPLAFSYREAMINILCHEIGHILGLRHEFAARKEKDDPSVLWGQANPDSVLNYYSHPLEMAVHTLDLDMTSDFYAYDEAEFQGLPIDIISP